MPHLSRARLAVLCPGTACRKHTGHATAGTLGQSAHASNRRRVGRYDERYLHGLHCVNSVNGVIAAPRMPRGQVTR
jgi:hypothetical protein